MRVECHSITDFLTNLKAEPPEAVLNGVHGVLKGVFPEITRHEVDAIIGGLGNATTLSTDPIDVRMSEIHTEAQLLAKLDYIRRLKRRPPRSGPQFRGMTDDARRLAKEVADEMKAEGLDPGSDPEKMLRTALEARKKRRKNQIADMQEQRRTGERIVKGKHEIIPDAEMDAIDAAYEREKALFDAMFPARELTPEQLIRIAIQAAEKSAAESERQMRTGDVFPAPRVSRTPNTKEVAAARARRDERREELKYLRSLIIPQATLDQRAEQSSRTRMAGQIADLTDQLARGDFEEKVPKVKRQLTPEEVTLKIELERVKRQVNEGMVKARLARRNFAKKMLDTTFELFGHLPRALKSGFDLSAALFQMGFFAYAHPIKASKMIGVGFKSLGIAERYRGAKAESVKGNMAALREFFSGKYSEAAAIAHEQSVEARDNYQYYMRGKLHLTSSQTQSLAQMEEMFQSRLAKHIPGVEVSQVAFTAMSNQGRADHFDILLADLASKKGGVENVTDGELRAIGHFINVASGRGGGLKFAEGFTRLNAIFYAPRLLVSRMQMLVADPLIRGTGARRAIAKEYARTLGGLAAIYSLGLLAGGDIDDDPTSSTYGTIRFGNTRVNPTLGLNSLRVLGARLISGVKTTQTGRVVPIRGEDVPYGSGNAWDLIGDFFRMKFSPLSGSVVNVLVGKTPIGEPTSLGKEALGLGIPLAFGDVYDAMVDHGIPGGTALGILAIFGMRMNTWKQRGGQGVPTIPPPPLPMQQPSTTAPLGTWPGMRPPPPPPPRRTMPPARRMPPPPAPRAMLPPIPLPR